jgi:hypothetical protein
LFIVILEKLRSGGLIVSCETIHQRSRVGMTRRELRHGCKKVKLATRMLAEEAEYWWTNAKGRLEASEEAVTWARFKSEFLRKYFPEDLRTKKEVEFLNLKQENR